MGGLPLSVKQRPRDRGGEGDRADQDRGANDILRRDGLPGDGAKVPGGQVVGETDARAEQPKDRPIRPEDITKTVYYAMGIKDLEAKDKLGRAYNLLDEGKPLTELFG